MTAWTEADVARAIEEDGLESRTGLYRTLSDQRCRSLATAFGLGPLRALASDEPRAGDLPATLREKLSGRIQLKGIDEVFFRLVVDEWRDAIAKRERIYA